MCPSSFAQQHNGYTGYADTRSCSTCDCEVSADSVLCSTTLRSYTERRCVIPSTNPNEARVESTVYSENPAISANITGAYSS